MKIGELHLQFSRKGRIWREKQTNGLMVCDDALRDLFDIPHQIENIIIDIYDKEIENSSVFLIKDLRSPIRDVTSGFIINIKKGQYWDWYSALESLVMWFLVEINGEFNIEYYFSISYPEGDQSCPVKMK